jgi:putative intracellular protease/amidase
MKIGVSSYSFSKYMRETKANYIDICNIAKETGFDGIVPFLLEDRLKELGAYFCAGTSWRSHVVVDGNLITGQNPRSAGSVAESLIREIRRSSGKVPLCRAVAWRYNITFF